MIRSCCRNIFCESLIVLDIFKRPGDDLLEIYRRSSIKASEKLDFGAGTGSPMARQILHDC